MFETFSDIVKGMEKGVYEYGFQSVIDNGNIVRIILGVTTDGEIYVESLGELKEEKNLKILKNHISGEKVWLPMNADPRKQMYSELFIILKNNRTGEAYRVAYKCGDRCASIENYISGRSHVSKEKDTIMSIYVVEDYSYKEIYNYYKETEDTRL